MTIPEGATTEEIGSLLQDAGVVASARAFVAAERSMKRDAKPGRYVFTSGVYPWVAVRLLAKGPPPPPDTTVVVPEGKRLEEIAEILERSSIASASEFLALARDPLFAKSLLGFDASSLEGFLFPDTYKFRPNTPAEAVIRRMHQRFLEEAAAESNPQLSPLEFVTLASIIEREARLEEERPRIAAVYWNRLRIGMKLEADPTVRYAVDKWDTTPVLFADLESPSPYNTYRVPGLPPGPICSPGRASLDAVAHPLETKELFFVARGDGGHVFAETFRQHRANVTAYRR